MDRFGSDKPDLRFGMELVNVSDLVKGCGFKVFADAVANGGSVRAINAKGCGGFSRKEIDSLSEFVKTYGAKGMAWIAVEENGLRSSIAKFFSEEELDALLKRPARSQETLSASLLIRTRSYMTLWALRVEIARRLGILNDTSISSFG